MTVTAAQSIAGVLKEVGAVGKDSRNAQQGFNYRGVDAVVNAVHPALAKIGGFIVPRMVSQEVEHATTSKGAAMVVVRLVTDYAWYGTDDSDPIVGRVSSEAFDTADKATAKAWSVAYRTFLLQTLNLPTDDPDPDSQYTERGHAPAATQGKPPAEWLADVKAAVSEADLGDIYRAAQRAFDGAVPDPLIQALSARKKQLQASAGGEPQSPQTSPADLSEEQYEALAAAEHAAAVDRGEA